MHSVKALLLFAMMAASASAGAKTLVLLSNLKTKATHSLFFTSLQCITLGSSSNQIARGHELTFAKADDPNLNLAKFGEFLYDNLVVFATNIEGKSIFIRE